MFLGTERLDIVARKGASFTVPIRVQTDEVVWKAISSIEKSAPAVIGVVGHECPTGWPITFHSVGGMTELNASEDDPGSKTYRVAPIDENTLSIPRLNTSRFRRIRVAGIYHISARYRLADTLAPEWKFESWFTAHYCLGWMLIREVLRSMPKQTRFG